MQSPIISQQYWHGVLDGDGVIEGVIDFEGVGEGVPVGVTDGVAVGDG